MSPMDMLGMGADVGEADVPAPGSCFSMGGWAESGVEEDSGSVDERLYVPLMEIGNFGIRWVWESLWPAGRERRNWEPVQCQPLWVP